jgi:parvulin-like peptidyl-prolyl isomerase
VPKAISNRRHLAAAVLGVFLVIFFIIVAIAQGIGDPSVPSGDVATVEDAPDGDVTTDEFNAALDQAAARQGVKKVPDASSPQYPALRDAAMSDVLLSRWVRGEAADRGISVSDTEITNRLDQIKKQQFGGDKQFQQFLKQAHFTEQDARDRVELMLLSDQIQSEVLPSTPNVSDSDIENFYEANISQFRQPETRDVRQIVNKDPAQVEQAKALLEKDDSTASWKTVASKYSTDKTTQDNGGLRAAVAEGQSDPALEKEIFDAPEGELVGPFTVGPSTYLIEVTKVNPETTTPLSDASKQIEQQLGQGIQQQTAQEFQQDFIDKWTSRTFCAKDYVMERCDNFEVPLQLTPGAAPVTSTRPVAPGQAGLFPGQSAQGLPQGPVGPAAAAVPPGGLPPGLVPQAGAPPGAAPQAPTPAPGG